MRVVLDSNVLLAAMGFGGLCRALLEACVESHEVILSEHILAEVSRHLRDKFHYPPSLAEDRVSFLRESAELVAPAMVDAGACRDPDDLPVLGTAAAGGADFLVTGDKDLLDLGQFEACSILSPREFWRRLK